MTKSMISDDELNNVSGGARVNANANTNARARGLAGNGKIDLNDYFTVKGGATGRVCCKMCSESWQFNAGMGGMETMRAELEEHLKTVHHISAGNGLLQ